jgi:peptidoglycan/LPS O-acetylase OafA/YrhL
MEKIRLFFKSGGDLYRPHSGLKARRTDIDLLRAVAVLAVLFFHFDIPGFKGGFLGVDIFFVISGYLITLHIRQQVDDSSFRFIDFYLRRIRRLFPALFAVLVLSSLAALFILPRSLLEEFTASQIAAATYVSNIYFWFISDYFDTESIVKPLLHTWSLSVEEQFYLVWPLFIVLCYRKQLNSAIALALVTSLLASEIVFDHSPSTAFYLFPFRIFEFSLGAIVSGIALPKMPRSLVNVLFIACVSTIVVTLMTATEQSRHPGFATLPLCGATALIILVSHPWANNSGVISTIFLRIGLISYSLYLVHWPLVVYYKIYHPGRLEIAESISLIIVSVLLAEFLFRIVEKPTGKINLARQRYVIASILPTMMVFAFSVQAIFPRNYDQLNPNKLTVASVLDEIPDRREVIALAQQEIEKSRVSNKPYFDKIVVVGDSHAVDLSLALQLQPALNEYSIELFHSICDPLDIRSINTPLADLYATHSQSQTRTADYCLAWHKNFVSELRTLEPDLIIFSEAWREVTFSYLAETICFIKQELPETEVLLLGRVLQFVGSPTIIFKNLETLEEINLTAWGLRWDRFDDFDPLIEQIAATTESSFISKQNLICQMKKCDLVIGGEITFTDNQHWSLVGMKHFGNRLVSKAASSGLLSLSDD